MALDKLTPRTRRFLVALGRRIRAAREATGVSQAALAQRLGMLRTNYARIEHGRSNLTIDTLLRIADGLDVDLTIAMGSDE